jgi:hypothetical protein
MKDLTGLFLGLFVLGLFIIHSILRIKRNLSISKDDSFPSIRRTLSRLNLFFAIPLFIFSLLMLLVFLISITR